MTEESNEVKREEPHSEPDEGTSDTGSPDREDPAKDSPNGTTGRIQRQDLHENDIPLVDRPGFQKLVAALLCLVTATVSIAMIALVLMAWLGVGADWHTAFSTVSIGLFGVLITGLFVFMAFRIDRGAKWEAQQVAEKAVERAIKAAQSTAHERAGKVAAKRAREVAAKKAKKVAAKEAKNTAAKKAKKEAEEVAKREFENTLRHVESVLGKAGIKIDLFSRP